MHVKWNKAEAIAEVLHLSIIKLCILMWADHLWVIQYNIKVKHLTENTFWAFYKNWKVPKNFYNGNNKEQDEFPKPFQNNMTCGKKQWKRRLVME